VKETIFPCPGNGNGGAHGFDDCQASGCSANVCTYNASHELGHMIGLQHQQQRQDRDHYVRINRWLGCSSPTDEGRCNRPNVSDFGPYDYKSVMHYGPTDPDIERWDGSSVCELVGIAGQCFDAGRDHPSAGDGAAVAELYRPQYGKFKRAMNVTDPSPYTRFQSPFDEDLAAGVRVSPTTSPAIEQWPGGSLAMYLRGTDNNIYRKSLDATTEQWSTSWEALGRPGASAASDPGVVSWASGRSDVVVRSGPEIFIMSSPNWGTWQNLGSPGNGAASAPAITSFGPNHLDVFVRAADDKIYHRWCSANCSGNSGTWSNWDALGADTFRGKPAVVSRGTTYIDLFAHGMNDKLWVMRFDPASGGWGSWSQVPFQSGLTLHWNAGCSDCNSPAAGSRTLGSVDAYVRGADDKLWWTTSSGMTWSGFRPLGGVLTSSPGAVTRQWSTNRADVVVVMAEERSVGAGVRHGTWWKKFESSL
jgi:hypothetical protein